MEKNNQGKEILKLIQDNYDIKSAQDLSSCLLYTSDPADDA